MNIDDSKKWIEEVISGMPGFLQNMRDSQIPGRYRYSLSGDIAFVERWGLGNCVYGVKTAYMLNRMDLIDIPAVSAFIKSFQRADGEISDSLIHKKSSLRRVVAALRSGDFNNINGVLTRRAETRQASAALVAMGKSPDVPYLKIPNNAEDVEKYISRLNWKKPWGAASHFSHLIFFLKYNSELFSDEGKESKELIAKAFHCADKYRSNDGSWSLRNSQMPDYQKINGAMKMMVAYDCAKFADFGYEKELIDLALSAADLTHACNNLNVICVLYYCSKNSCEYRRNEIEEYCLKLLENYKNFYFPEIGGFSFLPGSANRSYYGAIVTEGKNEPDIHGTHLFLWGITMITEILGIKDKFQLQLPIT
jgi:hypothetical protein